MAHKTFEDFILESDKIQARNKIYIPIIPMDPDSSILAILEGDDDEIEIYKGYIFKRINKKCYECDIDGEVLTLKSV